MKAIDVPFLNVAANDLHALDSLMDTEPLHPLNISPWPEFDTTASAAFSIAHLNDAIVLKYRVEEEVLKSFSRDFNDNVHLDNCVEFFIAFGDASDHYYNVELNCLGAIKIGYGEGRADRIPLEPEVLKSVKVKTKMDYAPGNGVHSFKWQLLVCIPVVVFSHDQLDSLEGKRFRANFYKCGDELPEPHFLVWNKVDTAAPDFHRPEFFGQLNFDEVSS